MAKVEVPETRYAHNGPVNLAYQTVGDGPSSVLFMASGINHLDYGWQYPPVVRSIERFAAFSRFVMFDKRGCGLSDRTVQPPTIDESVSDVVAILDELGIERAHLFGEGGGWRRGRAGACRGSPRPGGQGGRLRGGLLCHRHRGLPVGSRSR
jgi:pimeloyl-ACP methyl ester carboxylesterase